MPTRQTRAISFERNQKYTIKDFDSMTDWFFYTHIDPVQRFIHAFGMYMGLFFFAMMFIEWSLFSIVYYLLGAFFYYALGIVSHMTYDKGSGTSERKYLHVTFWPVIQINLATSLFYYDKVLRKFVGKYPFVIEAYDLIEVPRSKLFSHLWGNAFTPDGGS
jgi:hypothetical protein